MASESQISPTKPSDDTEGGGNRHSYRRVLAGNSSNSELAIATDESALDIAVFQLVSSCHEE